MNTVHLKNGLTGLHRGLRLGMHGKVEKIGVDPISISSDELCSVDSTDKYRP